MTIQALKDAALAATPGPWEAHHDTCAECERNGGAEFFFSPGPSGGSHATISGRDDAAFIALANPSAILSLIARMERSEAVLRVISDAAPDLPNEIWNQIDAELETPANPIEEVVDDQPGTR